MAAVHPLLAPYVSAITAYDVPFAAPGVHIGMPSTGLTFVLPVGEPLEVSWDAATRRPAVWSSVSGLHTRPAAIHHAGHQRGVQLTLTPSGARALWGVPASAVAGELLELADVDPALADLPERLAGQRSAADVLATLERALLAAVARHDAPAVRPEVARAMALLTRGSPVAATAREVGYSRRRLDTLVRDEVGVSPKTFQRLARFAGAHDRLRRAALAGEWSVAALAARCGYADQSHLTREWRELAGCSPTEWLRREFPNVQAVAGQDGGA